MNNYKLYVTKLKYKSEKYKGAYFFALCIEFTDTRTCIISYDRTLMSNLLGKSVWDMARDIEYNERVYIV